MMRNTQTRNKAHKQAVLKVTLLTLVFAFVYQTMSFAHSADVPINSRQVESFLKKNRSQLLVHYDCDHNPREACKVVCSSGGGKLIDVDYVKKAYYAERLNKINGALAGFYLIVDTDDDRGSKNLWATLQSESSCYFEGLSPSF